MLFCFAAYCLVMRTKSAPNIISCHIAEFIGERTSFFESFPMDSEASSIGSKSRATTFSVVSSSSCRNWNEEEMAKVIQSLRAMIDAMAYRGFSKARMVDISRMNSYVRQTFSLSQAVSPA